MTYHDAKALSDPDFQVARTALKGPSGPFAGWVVSGREWESFDVEGKVSSLFRPTVSHRDVQSQDAYALEGGDSGKGDRRSQV